ncbi:hypothetical protein J2Z50_000298 [Ensifer mexicanus]|nr:hypothetical protein [Sinorhizobium mexicanum]
MRVIVLLVALSALCACSQTSRSTTVDRYERGEGDYYPGIVPPTPF